MHFAFTSYRHRSFVCLPCSCVSTRPNVERYNDGVHWINSFSTFALPDAPSIRLIIYYCSHSINKRPVKIMLTDTTNSNSNQQHPCDHPVKLPIKLMTHAYRIRAPVVLDSTCDMNLCQLSTASTHDDWEKIFAVQQTLRWLRPSLTNYLYKIKTILSSPFACVGWFRLLIYTHEEDGQRPDREKYPHFNSSVVCAVSLSFTN